MKDIALVGLPSSGTSTVFEAVARTHAPHTREAHVAVVDVPDPRLPIVARAHGSAKITAARVQLVDIPGLDSRGLGRAREADALALVLRGFGDGADPSADLAKLRSELAVADLQTVERIAERQGKRARTGDAAAKAEHEAAERAEAVLSDGRWLSEEAWEPSQRRIVELWTPITIKPVLHVLNVGDEGGAADVPEPSVTIRGRLEAEVAELDPDEAREMLASYGLDEPATARFVHQAYETLHLITFFTAGPTEARAWETPVGSTARDAAGQIHTDFAAKFIRAERLSYADLVACGTPEDAKAKGLVRAEGRDYVVAEGDILLILHSA